MNSMLIVAIGGAIGSVARYRLSGLVLHHAVDWKFPIGTFVVNVLGCLVAGLLAGLVEKYEFFSADMRLFLFTGIAGGFTTFSAFSLETLFLLRRGEVGIAALYVVLSVLLGLLAMWLAFKVVSQQAG